MFLRGLGALSVALAVASGAEGQEASGPPPASSPDGGLYVHELLPDIGIIGAEVGLVGGLCLNPYDAGHGICGGGFIALPLRRVGAGRLSYEISLSVGHGRGEPFTITDLLAYVANLAAGAPSSAAMAGPPAAPFPVRRQVRTDLRLLQVSPFGLRYAFTSGRVTRVRPYLSAGIDAVVVLSTQEPTAPESTEPFGAPAFEGPLIGGLATESPELAERGLPSGQGNLRLGAHGALGVELRTSERLSLNVEYRFTAIEGAGGGVSAFVAAVGFHW
jgi:hypothetical protein